MLKSAVPSTFIQVKCLRLKNLFGDCLLVAVLSEFFQAKIVFSLWYKAIIVPLLLTKTA